jgi:hypothetical protein
MFSQHCILANRNLSHSQLLKSSVLIIFCRSVSVSPENLDLSPLKSLDDLINFVMASFELNLPVAMKLSLDLLQKQIAPKNVWYVLSRMGHKIELRNVCDEVTSSLNSSNWLKI